MRGRGGFGFVVEVRWKEVFGKMVMYIRGMRKIWVKIEKLFYYD